VGIKTIGYGVINLVKVTVCFYALIRDVISSIVLKTSKFAILVYRLVVRANCQVIATNPESYWNTWSLVVRVVLLGNIYRIRALGSAWRYL